MEFTSSPKPQLSSRANAFSIAALMSSGKPSSKDKEPEENTIKPLGKESPRPNYTGLEPEQTLRVKWSIFLFFFSATQQRNETPKKKRPITSHN